MTTALSPEPPPTYRHTSGDTGGECDACAEDDEPSVPHVAEMVGSDVDGPFCWCGHGVEVVE